MCKVKRKALGFLPSDSPFDGFMWSVNYPYDEYGVSERSVCSTLGIKSNMNVNEKYLSRELSFGDGLLSGILNWFIGAVKYGVYITNSIGFIPRYSSLYTPLASDSKVRPKKRKVQSCRTKSTELTIRNIRTKSTKEGRKIHATSFFLHHIEDIIDMIN